MDSQPPKALLVWSLWSLFVALPVIWGVCRVGTQGSVCLRHSSCLRTVPSSLTEFFLELLLLSFSMGFQWKLPSFMNIYYDPHGHRWLAQSWHWLSPWEFKKWHEEDSQSLFGGSNGGWNPGELLESWRWISCHAEDTSIQWEMVLLYRENQSWEMEPGYVSLLPGAPKQSWILAFLSVWSFDSSLDFMV